MWQTRNRTLSSDGQDQIQQEKWHMHGNICRISCASFHATLPLGTKHLCQVCGCILGGSCSFLEDCLPQPWSRSIITLFYFISTSDMRWAWDTFLLSMVGIGIAVLGLSDGVQNGGNIRNINHYQYDNIIALWSLWSGSDQFADLLLCISNIFSFVNFNSPAGCTKRGP